MAACPTLAPGDYRSAAEGFTRVAELPVERGDRLTTPLLPDLSITLEGVFTPAL